MSDRDLTVVKSGVLNPTWSGDGIVRGPSRRVRKPADGAIEDTYSRLVLPYSRAGRGPAIAPRSRRRGSGPPRAPEGAARAASPDELLVNDGTGRQPSILDEHALYLRERWNSGCSNATLLWQEIRARGYPGGYSQGRDYLARFRDAGRMPAPTPTPPKPWAVTALRIPASPGR